MMDYCRPPKMPRLNTVRKSPLILLIICSLLSISGNTYAAGTVVPISAELGSSIAGDLFPVTVKLTHGNLRLTDPVLRFLNKERIGMQLRFQAYDHRPEENIAISETGNALISGSVGYDPATREILLYNTKIDTLNFDRDSEVTRRLYNQLKTDWSAQVTNPIRTSLPPHPYLIPFRNNIRDLSFDGSRINLTLSYQ